MERVQQCLSQYQKGSTLPGPLYHHRDAFEFDVDKIFRRQWFYAATVCDVRESGDFYVVDLHNDSIVIVRDDEDRVRAFHNVCRHRGARMFNTQRGHVAKMLCPYHGWTYDLDGRLIHASSMGDKPLDPCVFGLKPVHCRIIAGLIFLCLAEEAPASIERATEDLSPYVQVYQLDKLKIAAEIDIVDEGNWKLVMENNRECYHCEANHPELLVGLHAYGFGFGLTEDDTPAQDRSFGELLKKRRAEWEACGLPHELIEFPDGLWYRTTRLPLANNANSLTMSGLPACKKLLHAFTQPDESDLSLWTHPNSWHHFMSDHVVTFRVLPLAENRTLVTTKWLVHEDAVEGVDYDVDTLTHVWKSTNAQDKRLVELAHRGTLSPAYTPGLYSTETEDLVVNFVDWYVRQASLQ